MKLFFPGMFFSAALFFAGGNSTSAHAVTIHIVEPRSTYISQAVTSHPQMLWTQGDTGYHQNPHPILHAIASLFGFNHSSQSSHSTYSFHQSTTYHSNYSNFSSNSSYLSTNHSPGIGGFFHGIVSAIGRGISGIVNTISNGIHYIDNTLNAIDDLEHRVIASGRTVINGVFKQFELQRTAVPPDLVPSQSVLDNAADKIPVILVHGGFSNSSDMKLYYNAFEKAGIPAYATTLGNEPIDLGTILDPAMGGTGPINQSTQQLSNFINKVQKDTGSPKVDLVGVSQAGLVMRDYLVHDQKNNIAAVATMGGAVHGTTLNGLVGLLNSVPPVVSYYFKNAFRAIIGPGNVDLMNNSPLVQSLDKYPDTKAGINYLNIASNTDQVITPWQSSYLHAVPGANVTNIEVHTIPGVPADFNHGEYGKVEPIVDRAVQFIENNGESGPGIPGKPATIAPAQRKPTITPPAVSLLG